MSVSSKLIVFSILFMIVPVFAFAQDWMIGVSSDNEVQYLVNDTHTSWDLSISMPVSAYMLGALGEFLGYDQSEYSSASTTDEPAIKNIHPVIELSERQKIFGFGFEF